MWFSSCLRLVFGKMFWYDLRFLKYNNWKTTMTFFYSGPNKNIQHFMCQTICDLVLVSFHLLFLALPFVRSMIIFFLSQHSSTFAHLLIKIQMNLSGNAGTLFLSFHSIYGWNRAVSFGLECFEGKQIQWNAQRKSSRWKWCANQFKRAEKQEHFIRSNTLKYE